MRDSSCSFRYLLAAISNMVVIMSMLSVVTPLAAAVSSECTVPTVGGSASVVLRDCSVSTADVVVNATQLGTGGSRQVEVSGITLSGGYSIVIAGWLASSPIDPTRSDTGSLNVSISSVVGVGRVIIAGNFPNGTIVVVSSVSVVLDSSATATPSTSSSVFGCNTSSTAASVLCITAPSLTYRLQLGPSLNVTNNMSQPGSGLVATAAVIDVLSTGWTSEVVVTGAALTVTSAASLATTRIISALAVKVSSGQWLCRVVNMTSVSLLAASTRSVVAFGLMMVSGGDGEGLHIRAGSDWRFIDVQVVVTLTLTNLTAASGSAPCWDPSSAPLAVDCIDNWNRSDATSLTVALGTVLQSVTVAAMAFLGNMLSMGPFSLFRVERCAWRVEYAWSSWDSFNTSLGGGNAVGLLFDGPVLLSRGSAAFILDSTGVVTASAAANASNLYMVLGDSLHPSQVIISGCRFNSTSLRDTFAASGIRVGGSVAKNAMLLVVQTTFIVTGDSNLETLTPVGVRVDTMAMPFSRSASPLLCSVISNDVCQMQWSLAPLIILGGVTLSNCSFDFPTALIPLVVDQARAHPLYPSSAGSNTPEPDTSTGEPAILLHEWGTFKLIRLVLVGGAGMSIFNRLTNIMALVINGVALLTVPIGMSQRPWTLVVGCSTFNGVSIASYGDVMNVDQSLFITDIAQCSCDDGAIAEGIADAGTGVFPNCSFTCTYGQGSMVEWLPSGVAGHCLLPKVVTVTATLTTKTPRLLHTATTFTDFISETKASISMSKSSSTSFDYASATVSRTLPNESATGSSSSSPSLSTTASPTEATPTVHVSRSLLSLRGRTVSISTSSTANGSFTNNVSTSRVENSATASATSSPTTSLTASLSDTFRHGRLRLTTGTLVFSPTHSERLTTSMQHVESATLDTSRSDTLHASETVRFYSATARQSDSPPLSRSTTLAPSGSSSISTVSKPTLSPWLLHTITPRLPASVSLTLSQTQQWNTATWSPTGNPTGTMSLSSTVTLTSTASQVGLSTTLSPPKPPATFAYLAQSQGLGFATLALTTISSLATGSPTVLSVQFLAVIGQVYGSSENARQRTLPMAYILSPFWDVSTVAIALGNLGIIGVFVGVHAALSRREQLLSMLVGNINSPGGIAPPEANDQLKPTDEAASGEDSAPQNTGSEDFAFPGLSFLVAVVLYQGLAAAAFRIFYHESGGRFVVGALCLVAAFVLPLLIYWVLFGHLKQMLPSYTPMKPTRKGACDIRALVRPRGRWAETAATKSFGRLFCGLAGPGAVRFAGYPVLLALLVNAAASANAVSKSQRDAQFGVLGLLFLVASIGVAVFRPHRSHVANVVYVVAFVLLLMLCVCLANEASNAGAADGVPVIIVMLEVLMWTMGIFELLSWRWEARQQQTVSDSDAQLATNLEEASSMTDFGNAGELKDVVGISNQDTSPRDSNGDNQSLAAPLLRLSIINIEHAPKSTSEEVPSLHWSSSNVEGVEVVVANEADIAATASGVDDLLSAFRDDEPKLPAALAHRPPQALLQRTSASNVSVNRNRTIQPRNGFDVPKTKQTFSVDVPVDGDDLFKSDSDDSDL